MSKIIAVATAALWAGIALAAPTRLPDHTPLVSDGEIVIDSTDFEGNMMRIPEEHREQVRMSHERVASIVDNMFVARSLAARARAAGLDKDPAVQKRLQQVQDGVLADLYVQKIEKEALPANLEQRARELYLVDKAKFVTTEQVHVQHILVDLKGRTRDTARERALAAVRDAKAGEDFLAVATRYSDDPDKKRNGGDLGYNSPSAFVEPVRAAIASLKTKGEIAGPVESDQGFHVIRFVDRKPAEPVKFEAVAKDLIEAERARIKKQRLQALIEEVRAAPTVVVHRENVEKLVVPVDPKVLGKVLEERPAAKK